MLLTFIKFVYASMLLFFFPNISSSL